VNALTSVTPSGSTLLPGQAVDVSVLPHPVQKMYYSVISVDTDVASSQSVQVDTSVETLSPPTNLPPDIDFGNVKVGSTVTAFIDLFSVGIQAPGIYASMSDTWPVFYLSGKSPLPGLGWTVTFQPDSIGEQVRTITFSTMLMPVCPPNTITARGVGVAP